MTIREIHQRIKLGYNKIDSNHKPDIPPAYLDLTIQGVINDYIDIFYSGNNFKRFKLGFEVTQQRIDMLGTLVESTSLQAFPLSEDDETIIFPFSNLDKPYRNWVRGTINTECGNINIKPTQHGELNFTLNDPMQRSSRKWKRLVSAIRSNPEQDDRMALIVYPSEDFPINEIGNEITLEYIRQPRVVFFGGYNSIDGLYNASDDPVTTDLPEPYHYLIVDMAVQELARNLADGAGYQLITDKIITKS